MTDHHSLVFGIHRQDFNVYQEFGPEVICSSQRPIDAVTWPAIAAD